MKKLTEEYILSEAKKYKTLDDFHKKSGSAYQTARTRGILDKIVEQAGLSRQKLFLGDAELAAIAKKYKYKKDFKANDNPAFQATKRRGREFMAKVCAHMEKAPQPITFGIDEAFALAKKCEKRTDLKKAHPTLYQGLKRHGLLDKAFAHIPNTRKKPSK